MFFCPAFLAVKLFEKQQENELTVRVFVAAYAAFVCIINLLCLGIFAIVFHYSSYSLTYDALKMMFVFKYLLLAFFLSAVLPFTNKYVKKRFDMLINRERMNANEEDK